MKKEGKIIPTNNLFLTFSRPNMPREIKVGYLTVKVDRFVLNPLCDVLTATSLATQASVAKQQQNVTGVGKINMKSSVTGPRYALTAMVLMLHLPKIAWFGGRKRRKRSAGKIQRIRVEKRISFLKPDSWLRRSPRHLVSLPVCLLLTWSTRRNLLSLWFVRRI